VNGQVFFLIAGVFVHVLSTNYQFESWEEARATAICMLVLSEIDDVLWATAICMLVLSEIDDVLSSVSAHYKPHYGVERKWMIIIMLYLLSH
jgi:hypothetical protein